MASTVIAPGFVEDALACLTARGMAAGHVLRAAGLAEPVVGPVTAEQYGLLWLAMAEATDDEFFGLGARPMRRGSFALMCHAVLHAPTLQHVLKRALQFLRVVLDEPHGELLTARDGNAQIVLSDAGGPRPAFAYRTFWLILLGLACWLVGRRIALKRVDFAGDGPAHRADYRHFFGAPVHFGEPASRIVFDASYLALPTIRSEKALQTFLRGAPANILVRYRHDEGLTAQIRALLKTTPPSAWPDFERLSAQLRIPPATLRRRLQAEGQGFAAIKDEIRRALALTLLGDTPLSIAAIAGELGFTEPSAFHRAFRKWMGVSPGEFRRVKPQ